MSKSNSFISEKATNTLTNTLKSTNKDKDKEYRLKSKIFENSEVLQRAVNGDVVNLIIDEDFIGPLPIIDGEMNISLDEKQHIKKILQAILIVCPVDYYTYITGPVILDNKGKPLKGIVDNNYNEGDNYQQVFRDLIVDLKRAINEDCYIGFNNLLKIINNYEAFAGIHQNKRSSLKGINPTIIKILDKKLVDIYYYNFGEENKIIFHRRLSELCNHIVPVIKPTKLYKEPYIYGEVHKNNYGIGEEIGLGLESYIRSSGDDNDDKKIEQTLYYDKVYIHRIIYSTNSEITNILNDYYYSNQINTGVHDIKAWAYVTTPHYIESYRHPNKQSKAPNDRELIDIKEEGWPPIRKTYSGFVPLDALYTQTEQPEPDATLVKVEREKINSGIFNPQDYYPNLNYNVLSIDEANRSFTQKKDAEKIRFYANALLFLNNPKNENTIKIAKKNENFFRVKTSLKEVNSLILSNKSITDNILDGFRKYEPSTRPYVQGSTDLYNDMLHRGNWNWSNWEKYLYNGEYLDIEHIKFNKAAKDQAHSYIWIPSEHYLDIMYNYVDNYYQFKSTTLQQRINNDITTILDFGKTIYNIGKYLFDNKNGFELDVDISGAFAIPLDANLGTKLSIYIDDKDVIHITRTGFLGAAASLGVGAGFFLGSPAARTNSRRFRTFEQEDNVAFGIGGKIGAQVSAGSVVMIRQKYKLDYKNDFAIASILSSSLGKIAVGGVGTMIGLFDITGVFTRILSSFKPFGVDIDDYMTEFHLELALYNQASVSAEVGLQFGGDPNQKRPYELWTRSDSPKSFYDEPKSFLTRMLYEMLPLSLEIDMTVGEQIATGIKVTFPSGTEAQDNEAAKGIDDNFYKHPTRVPPKTQIEWYIQKESLNNLNIPVPFIMGVIQFFSKKLNLSPVQRSAKNYGAKFVFSYDYATENYLVASATPSKNSYVKPILKFEEAALYFFKGDVDTFSGPAREVSLLLQKPKNDLSAIVVHEGLGGIKIELPLLSINSSQEHLKKFIGGFEFNVNFGVSGLLLDSRYKVTKNLKEILEYQERGLSVLQKASDDGKIFKNLIQNKAFTTSLMTKVKFKVGVNDIENLVNILKDIWPTKAITYTNAFEKLYQFIFEHTTAESQEHLNALAQFFNPSHIAEITFHGRAGIALGGGAQIQAIVRVKLNVFGAAAIIWHYPITENSEILKLIPASNSGFLLKDMSAVFELLSAETAEFRALIGY